jgi:protein tyrosine/serine phosphatase
MVSLRSPYSAVLAIVLTWSPLAVHAQSAFPVAVSHTEVDLSRVRIDNFGQINPNYYRGAQPERRDYADLAALGIKTVIDLQHDGPADESNLVRAAGMRFFRIPMTTHVPPTREQLAVFLQIVNDPANQPVYVHCAGGRHRTGVMTAAYRMTNDRWTADQAFKEMKRYQFGADFLHPEFKQFVFAYKPSTIDPAPQIVVAREATESQVR